MHILFTNAGDAVSRLQDPRKMSLDEIRSALRYFENFTPQRFSRLQADLVEHTVDAIRDFDHKSASLTRWLIGLTVALVLLTGALLFFTIKLAVMVR